MQQDRLQDTTPHDARPQCAECKTQDDRAQDVGRKLDGRRTKVGRTSDGSWMDVERKLDGRRTKVGRTWDGRRTNVGCKLDGRRTSRAQPPLLRWQVAALHCNSWQRNAAARPAERCNSLLWRGRQSVATRCCGKAGNGLQLAAAIMASNAATRGAGPATLQLAALGRQRYNSRRWAGNVVTRGAGLSTLQLAAMADSALQPWPTLRYNIFVFFVLLNNFKSERERDRKRKGGRAFETCSKISTLLVGRNVTCKLPLVPTQAPSGSNNTNTLRLRQ